MTARLTHQQISREQLIINSERICHLAMKPFCQSFERKTLDSNIIEIFERALELDAEMSMQKASFYFSYLGCSPHYNREEMDMIRDRDDDNDGTNGSWDVDLFVAPALCKCGTAEGQAYDTKSILMLTEVLCSPHRTRRAASPHSTYTTASTMQTHQAPSPHQVRRATTMPTTTRSIDQVVRSPTRVIYAPPLQDPYQRT